MKFLWLETVKNGKSWCLAVIFRKRSVCFTVLQYINNLKTERPYQRKVNLKNLKFFKVDQNVYKPLTRAL